MKDVIMLLDLWTRLCNQNGIHINDTINAI